MKKRDLSTYRIRAHPCHSCPFAGKKPVELQPEQLVQYHENLLNGGQHICHSSQKTICRGGRIIQLRWFHLIRLLPEPTDAAFNQAIVDAKK